MLAKIQTAVSLLYPPRCLGCGAMVDSDFGLCGPCWRDTPFIDGTVCESCGVPVPGQADEYRTECDECMKTPRPWSDGRSALLYKGRARRLVLGFKHGDRPEVARPAALWMARAARTLMTPGMLIAPVPLHWTRLLKRRYNQSALLSQALSEKLELAYCPDLLVRKKRTSMMNGKSATQRYSDLDGAIDIHPKRRHRLMSRRVLLVDDVMTTGATLAACTHACLDAGVDDVCVLTLARVAKTT